MSQGPRLRREMSMLDLTMASVGGVIGSGWLLGAATSATYAGPAAIFAWIIGGIFTLFLALPFVELSSMVPESGALVRYPQFSHGSLTGFIMGWGLLLGYLVTPPLEAEAVVQYANNYVHGLYNGSTLSPLGLLVAAALVLVFFVLNYYGVRLFAKANTTITLIKFLVPTATMVSLLVAGFHAGNVTDAAHGGFLPFGWRGVFSAVSLGGIAFAYQGFRQSIDLAGEGKNPRRDVPRAVLTTLLITVSLYTLLQLAFIGALTQGDLSHGWAHLNFSSPYAQLALALNMGWLAIALYGDAIISPMGTGLVYTASSSRVLWAFPQNGYGPRWFTKVHPRHNVPVNALLVVLLFSLVALLPFPAWSQLVGIAGSLGVVNYMMGPVAALVLRRTAPDLPRTIRLKGMTWIGLVSFVVGALIIYWTGWPYNLYIGVGMLVGFAVYLYYHVRNRYAPQELKAGVWLAVMILFEIAVSYAGSFGGRGILPYPWDIVIVVLASVVFYFWAIASGFETEAVRRYRQETLAAEAAPAD